MRFVWSGREAALAVVLVGTVILCTHATDLRAQQPCTSTRDCAQKAVDAAARAEAAAKAVMDKLKQLDDTVKAQGGQITAVQSRIFKKGQNIGTVSCDEYCGGQELTNQWGDLNIYNGSCLGAKIVSGPAAGRYIGCNINPNKYAGGVRSDTICTCWKPPD
jgi:hypothetical protein